MKLFYKYAQVIPVFILAIFLVSCGDDDDDDELPQIVAGFTQTINENTGTVTFINTSENADTYLWDFGDSTTSTEINPIKTYINGEYIVVLTASNGAGASDTFEDTFTILIPEIASLPITFDAANTRYEPEVFNGASFEIVANPDESGTNDKAGNVGAITNSGAAFEGVAFDLGTAVNLTNGNTIEMNFWSEDSIDVLLKLEITETNAIETTASHGGTGWEMLSFEFASSDTYPKLVLFADGPGTTSGTFYFDDVVQAGVVGTVPVIMLNGDATVNINVGDTFEDPGAEADDTEDGDISDQIVIGGDVVDVNVEGTYMITYNVTDSDGNDAAEVVRTVIVSAGDPCTPETAQSLSATDLNLTFQTDPGDDIFNDGGAYTFVDNPDFDNMVNTSCKVGQIVRDAGLEFANSQISFDSKFDFNSNSGFKLKVYSSQTSYQVTLKLEDKADDGIATEISQTTSVGANEWEELTFDFPASESDKYDKIVLFFQLGTFTDGTYFIDDLALYGDGGGSSSGCTDTPVAATSLPLDFESCESFINAFSSIDGGVVPSLDVNPSQSGINTSDNVLKVVRASGINRWGGIQNSFPAGVIDITTQVFKIKVYTSVADVTYRFELALDPQTDPATGNPAPVFRQVTGGANTWTEIEFTFTGLPATPTTYNQLVIKPDNPDGSDGEVTTEERVFYFDDLLLADSGGSGSGCTDTPVAATTLPVDFESCESFISSFSSIGDGGVVPSLDSNPSQSGINTSDNVLKVVRASGINRWGGIQNSFPAGVIDITTQVFKIKVYTSVADVTYRFELALDPQTDPATGNPAPVFRQVTGGANTWTEIEFTFTGLPATPTTYNQLVIKPDNPDGSDGEVTTEERIFYFDDLLLADSGGSGSGCTDTPVAATTLPVDFESCESFISSFSSIGDGGVVPSLDSNPSQSGINTSDNVLKVVKASGINRWGGVQNSFPAGVIDITTKVFKIKVYTSVADVTYRFELALDPQTDPVTGNPAPVFRQVTGGANTWTEIEFTFTGLPATPTTYNQLVIKPDNPDGSDGEVTTEERIFYFDDLRLE